MGAGDEPRSVTMVSLPGGVANLEQAEAWNGADGADWTEYEDYFNASIRPHTSRLFEAARISKADRVLDVGCGCGESTRRAARQAAAGSAFGIDLSASMLARARQRGREEGLANVSFTQGDAQVYPFRPGSFDTAISRFGVMFFADPVAAFRNIGGALRSGGRLAMLVWQELAKNEWLTTLRGALAAGRTLPTPPVGAPGPFGLADQGAVRAILARAGFGGIRLVDVHEPIRLGADPDDAFRFVRGLGLTRGMLQDLDEPTRERALGEVRALLEAHSTGEGVLFGSRAWLITARRP